MSHIPDWSSPLDTEGTGESGLNLSRRRLLKGTAVAGAVALGSGTAAAAKPDEPGGEGGQGGQAVVAKEDYFDKSFEILEWTEPMSVPDGDGGTIDLPYSVETFTCERPGKGITLVGWRFRYLDDLPYKPDEENPDFRVMYTRDNRIDTTVNYEWSSGGLTCLESDVTYLQKGYVAGESRQ
ncbi:twin-arginine translocation signal domain-containing protein [Halodesulfurarchaeum sp.]|uniref:twin-arginine translocation signal domain-containing protein n=1 Tax=Halodesulfurarchaeum sp. TaxID=1980530 RepID=UPI002FC2D570